MTGADFAAWLSARYDEAEARERKMLEMLARADRDHGPCIAICFDDGTSGNAFDWNPWDVLADYDPAHRLADIALKRAILAEHSPEPPPKYGHDVPRCAACLTSRGGWQEDWRADPWPCATVRQLGTEFAARPDYDPSCAPEQP